MLHLTTTYQWPDEQQARVAKYIQAFYHDKGGNVSLRFQFQSHESFWSLEHARQESNTSGVGEPTHWAHKTTDLATEGRELGPHPTRWMASICAVAANIDSSFLFFVIFLSTFNRMYSRDLIPTPIKTNAKYSICK